MTPPDTYFANPDYQRLEAAFHDYVAQGEGRNITWLVSKTGLPLNTIARGMVAGFWPQRIQSIGKNASLVVQAKLVGDVVGMNERDLGRLVELEDEAFTQLIDAIKNKLVKPDTLAKIVLGAQERRRKILGLGEGTPAKTPMEKLLEGSLVGEATPSFKLDPKQLEAPSELPAMPGMTSDDAEDPKRPLDPEEKELLRP
jgi:hypothetical protein